MTWTTTVVGVVVAPSGTPVTCMEMSPAGTPARIEIVKTLEPVGVTLGGLNESHENCCGTGGGDTQDRETDSAVPEANVAVMVTVPLVPAWIVTGPSLERV